MLITATRTLKGALEDKARRFPDETFLVFEDAAGAIARWTWREFDADVNRAAHLLLARGLRHGDKFNLHLGNGPEFLLFWMAAAKTGTVMVPTNPVSTAGEMEYILGHSEARLAITEPQYAAPVYAAAGRCPALGGVLEARPLAPLLGGLPSTPPDTAVASLDEISMQYTSGTTSRPKGVLLTHANYLYGGEALSKAMRVGPADRHLIVLPLFAAPIRMLLAQPRAPRDGQTRLRAVSYAQNVTLKQFEEWHERFRAPLMQIWGMTETMSLPLLQPLDLPRKPLSMGMPVLGYECKVVDESGKEAPPGTVGELVVRGIPGVSLMKGYFRNERATAETLRDGWLHSGDQAYMDEDGYFFFVDRKKDMIKRAGENVSASEVEETLKQHPAVFDAAVVGVPDPVRDQAIKAYVIFKDGAAATSEELIAWCRRGLSLFKVPEVVEIRETFPRTSEGKIQKHLF